MKSALRYLLLGLPLYLLFLIALFPATQAWRYAAEPLAKAMPELKVSELDGSIWSGRAGMVVFRQALLGEVSWQLSPLPLVLGEARLKALLQSDDGYLQSHASLPLEGGGISLADTKGQLPVPELLRFTPYLPVVLEGQFAFNLSQLELTSQGLINRAEGTVVWHQAAMSAPQALPLGDLQLTLHTEEEGKVTGEITDRSGPLKVEGTLQLSPDRNYRFNGTVAPATDAPASVKQALGWLGKPDAQGRYRFSYSGRM